MKIDEFKKGDTITRVEPVTEIKSDGFGFIPSQRESKDYGLIGKPLEFIGIANGLIYYKHKEGITEGFKQPQSIVHDKYKDGWAKYIDPDTL